MDKFSRIIKSKIVRIGNSQGVRIPHFLLQQLHLANEVEMSIQDDQLVIRAARKPRQDWDARFSRLLPAESLPSGDEILPQLTDWDGTEWTW
jgi:antitoxin MazE